MKTRTSFLILLLIGLFSVSLYGAQLTSVTAVANDNTAGTATYYTFNLTTSTTGNGIDTGIPADGKINIIFPSGFDLSGATIAQSDTPLSLDGGLTATVSGDTIKIVRDGTGSPVLPNTAVGVKVAIIGNHQTAGTTYSVEIETRLNDDTLIDNGTSNTFSITHNSLASFQFNAITTQTAGANINLTITALDQYGNQVNTFTNTATLSDLTGMITPTTTTNFISGSWAGVVVITQAVSNNTITATSQNQSGTSNQFDVNPSGLDHFSFQTITSPKVAGDAFSITISAEDQYDNLITTFSNPVALSDSTGTINPPATGSFTGGEWTGNVTITKKQDDVAIIATYTTITDQSNLFNVNSAVLNKFSIETVFDQTAGSPFVIQVSALDQFDNVVDDFDETVNISDQTGTVTPTVSGSFDNGLWTGNVTIDQVHVNNTIDVVRTSTLVESGTSNSFNVTSNNLDHFTFSSISSPQTAGISFNITITAMDGFGNTAENFTGTASLTELTGTINTGVTGNFVGGIWSGNVLITKSQTSNRITATSGGKSGTSNNFDVNSQSVDHFRFQTVSSPQVAGQKFPITIIAEDQYDNQVVGFTDVVTLEDPTGTISPAVTKNFTSGQVTDSVSVTKSQMDIRITANWNTSIGYSNYFNVDPAPLYRFSINNIGTQAAGEPFTITVTAQDFFNNRVNSFAGTVDVIDLSGTVTPVISDNFEMGQWSGAVTVTKVTANNRITVTRSGGVQTGSSNQFDVLSGSIDYFEVSAIGDPQTAGNSFGVTITAKDVNGETVSSFSGSANLSDLSGTASPVVTGTFVSGVWMGNVTVTKSYTNNVLTVNGSGKSGNSNEFDVQPAAANRFVFENIASPQTAGQNILLSIQALDSYDNLATSFSGTADLSDNTGTISPTTTTAFAGGQWSGNATITTAQNDVEIFANQGAINGTSNSFNVQASTLHHFILDNISTQIAADPFAISVSARDEHGNSATSFAGKVIISDNTGTINPTLSSNFVSGSWTGNVTITQIIENNVITVTNQAGSENGNSNQFDVESNSVDHFAISTISNQIAGQQFSITIRAEDSANNLVDSYTGTADLSDLTGTVNPVTTGNFTSGQWSGLVEVTKSFSQNRITATDGTTAGQSNQFNVSHAALDHFNIQPVSSPQTAGQQFQITIYAEDNFNNRVTSFNTFVNLTDETMALTPATTGNFSSGEWTGNVTITKAYADNKISADQSGRHGESNLFNINPASLSEFEIESISSQAAGEPFLVSITALDGFSNTATQFAGTVDIEDLTTTIVPARSNNFTNGTWLGNVSISQAMNNDVITVTRTGGAETGQSNQFNVIASSVDSFVIGSIANPQIAGNPFLITITAIDGDGNTVTGFTGTTSLSDLSGTISPRITGSFVNGSWTGQVTLTEYYLNNEISVSGLGESGHSNSFNVTHNVLDHFELMTIASPQVAGAPFSITIQAMDAYENIVLSHTAPALLTDSTGTISPSSTTAFSSGTWTGNVTITKSQQDVRIIVEGSGKNGHSNFFNIRSASLHHFDLNPLSTQAAGEPFLISVTARDTFENQVTSFAGTVDIADLTLTVTPTKSGNFIGGKWDGNITITQAMENDIVTVTRTGGSEQGQSNFFDVTSSTVDHFEFSAIATPQTAGVLFPVTITAKDGDGNTVVTFTGTVTLTDHTGTLSPTVTANFTAGEWSGDLKITQAGSDNQVFASGIGKSGESNLFNVQPGELDHFNLSEVFSPQTAGLPFTIEITAKDSMENTVTDYAFNVNLSDNTGTISPTATTNFSGGRWTGPVEITKKQNDVFITASRLNASGHSNYFNINPAPLNYLKITDAAGGTGVEVGSLSMLINEQIMLYASGYDEFGNYTRDVIANWGVTGTLESPSPTFGKFTVFSPDIPGTFGEIFADTTGILSDTTGTISVSATIDYVKIRTAPNGEGSELFNFTMTADENIELYCAGYDNGDNYIGDVVVQWMSTGELSPVIDQTGVSINFQPSLAPASGTIIADHSSGSDDTTGVINVLPGVPVGEITLTPSPQILPADGASISIVRSGNIYDAESNIISENTQFTVSTTLGTIASTDVNHALPGKQVAADDSGRIEFVFQSSQVGGTAFISVSSVTGSAIGDTTIFINSIGIDRILSVKNFVSQGQLSIPIKMVINNLGPNSITNLAAGLFFTGPAPGYENRDNDFPNVQRTDGITYIAGFSADTLDFVVDVSPTAIPEIITVDGWVSGQIGVVAVTDTFATITKEWTVQTPAELKILKVSSILDTVSQGRTGISVKMDVMNTGQADAVIDLDTLKFWSLDQSVDVTGEYDIISSASNPVIISGDSSLGQFDYTVNVGTAATQGNVEINGEIKGSDFNTDYQITDSVADTTHHWFVKSAPLVGIKGFYPSQSQVTSEQTLPWQLTMIVENNGETAVELEKDSLFFLLKGVDITDEYDIVYPAGFVITGNETLQGYSSDTLKYIINQTGSSTGEITIRGAIYLRDTGTGNQLVDESLTGISVLDSASIKITGLIASQSSATINQMQDWNVKVAIFNEGGTDIDIDTLAANTHIVFSGGSDYLIKQPESLGDGDLILEAGTTDTLLFVVDKTGSLPGSFYINAQVTGIQTTSGDSLVANSEEPILVLIEEPAKIRVSALENITDNAPFVNTGQNFWLKVDLENNGQDKIEQAALELVSSGGSTIGAPTIVVTDIDGTSVKSDTFSVTAAATPNPGELFSVRLTNVIAENTQESLGVILENALDSLEVVVIQNPATFEIVNIIAPVSVTASQVEPWLIKVVVENNGGAGVEIDPPKESDVVIKVEGEIKSDYIIVPPDQLSGGGLVLAGGSVDTLIYVVTTTGEDAGNAVIEISQTGHDQNDGQLLSGQNSHEFYIQSTAAVQLKKTKPVCLNYDAQLDKGYVNRGQMFLVRVWVQNLGRKKVRDVVINLTQSYNSIINEPQKTIASIEHGSMDSVDFEIIADPDFTRINEVFTSEIISAQEYDTGLDAIIDNSGDTIARVAIQDSANLKMEAHTENYHSIYTINQVFAVNAKVKNLGSPAAQVDSSGTLRISIPDSYGIIVEGDTLQGNNVASFYPEVEHSWSILTPEVASDQDTIFVSILNVPNDKNIQQPANVTQQTDTILVKTESTNIIYSTKIAEPEGAVDSVLSTQQSFVVQTDIQYSPNLENVIATLSLPSGNPAYRFDAQTDSSQNVISLDPVRWKIRAPDEADNESRKIIITIRADEQGNPVPVLYRDSLEVITVERAELVLGAIISYPEGAQDGKITAGQRYEIKAEVNTKGAANVYGDGFLVINLGSTGSHFADTTETSIKPFQIDMAVTWNLRASEIPVSQSDIIVRYLEGEIPKDENTNNSAYVHPDNENVRIPITTVEGGFVEVTAEIQGPPGAKDGIISTHQNLDIGVNIISGGVKDIQTRLILSGNFDFDAHETPVKGGEEPTPWQIIAPSEQASNVELKVVSVGVDVNDDTLAIYSDTSRVYISVVEKAMAEVFAEIVSPTEATDRIVSIGQEFVVQGNLYNHGQAEFDGTYNLELKLPDGYTTTDNLIKDLSGLDAASWQIKAPDVEMPAANIEVRVPQAMGPNDQNTGEEVAFWEETRSVNFAITTYEKSVFISKLANRTPNSVVNGQQNVSMLGLRFYNPKEEELANSLVLTGMEMNLTDREGNNLAAPEQMISRIAICSYSNPENVFGEVTSFETGSMIRILFTLPDTILPDEADSLDLIVDIAESPEKQSLLISIPADTNIFIREASTLAMPLFEGDFAEGNFQVESDFIRILGDNLKESFGNYPNPFGNPDRKTTTITYYLKEDTEVEIKIYTLIGELVWSRLYPLGDARSKKGTHEGDVTWDARNDKGYKVLNGVYIIYLKTGYGETATTKAAVIK